MASRMAQVMVFAFLIIGVATQLTAPPGPKGFKGAPGPPGQTGEAGPQGEVGAEGEKGEKGAPGVQGSQGSAGAQGADGDEGVTGEPGVQGSTGSSGAIGSIGEPGISGETGASGVTGMTGSTGVKGPKGDRGTLGNVGENGIVGIPGEKGEPGQEGIIGPSGEKGDQGEVGQRGPSLKDIDRNECSDALTNNCDPASTQCVNWATGYRCQCKPGYQAVNGSLNVCEDINECDINNGDCAGTCTNTVGSYSCSCPPTLSLTENRQCADINECNTSPCGSASDVYCINKYNGYTCVSSTLPQDSTTAAAGVAQALTVAMSSNNIIILLLAWFGILTFIGIVILIWLIYIFHKMKKEREQAENNDSMYSPSGGMVEEDFDEDLSMPEGMASQSSMQIDVARPPRSLRGTWKGASKGSLKGKQSYKAGKSSRPGSVSSGTGAELRTASVTQHRVAAGERSSANRLSGVDTFY